MIGPTTATSARSVEWIETRAGRFWFAAAAADGTLRAGWMELEPPRVDLSPAPAAWSLATRLARHFAGEFDAFEDLPLPDGPEFFRACWSTLRTSRPGERWTYRELAARAGRPAAVRAAGAAMRRNPLPILIPCHRIVASDGSLGGYAGGWGPEGRGGSIKRFLLGLEAAHAEKGATFEVNPDPRFTDNPLSPASGRHQRPFET